MQDDYKPTTLSEALANSVCADAGLRVDAMRSLGRIAMRSSQRARSSIGIDSIANHQWQLAHQALHHGLCDEDAEVGLQAARGLYAMDNRGAECINDVTLYRYVISYARHWGIPPLSSFSPLPSTWHNPVKVGDTPTTEIHLIINWRMTDKFSFTLGGKAPHINWRQAVGHLSSPPTLTADSYVRENPTAEIPLHGLPDSDRWIEPTEDPSALCSANLHLRVPIRPNLMIRFRAFIGGENTKTSSCALTQIPLPRSAFLGAASAPA
jgi:hypothetical protein